MSAVTSVCLRLLTCLRSLCVAVDSGAVVDYRDWQVPLGRRFRAMKLWTVLHTLGLDGLQDHLRTHVALAGELADRVVAQPGLALAAPRDLADVRRRLEALSCALVARRPIITGNEGAGPQRSTTGYWLHPIQDALSPASIRSIWALFLCSSAFGTGGDSRPIQQGMVCDLNHSEEVSGPYKEQSYPL